MRLGKGGGERIGVIFFLFFLFFLFCFFYCGLVAVDAFAVLAASFHGKRLS